MSSGGGGSDGGGEGGDGGKAAGSSSGKPDPCAAAAAAAAAAVADAGDGAGAGAGAASSSSSSARPAGADAQAIAVYDPEAALILAEQAERDQAEMAMMQQVLGAVFSTRKPRDVIAGTSSGLKTMSKSIGLGLAALVAQPYLGAKQSGAKGFVKGVGTGLATCTAATVAGTVVGTGQIVRGVLNTPRAIVQKSRGQVWNSESRKWEVNWYSLPEEAALVLGEGAEGLTACDSQDAAGGAGSATGSKEPRRPAKKVADRTLYDLLDVPPEATDGEIRKAFYKKSLALHPDKNPDNPEATEKFQAISDAYRVLGDEERRRAYDEHGKDSAAAGLPKIEPAVFFAALFGSHHFEPLVGRLRLAQEIDGDLQSLLRDAAATIDEDSASVDVLKIHRAQQQMKKVERVRQVKLAVELAKRIEPMANLPVPPPEDDGASAAAASDDPAADEASKIEEKWLATQRAEAEMLSAKPFGTEMLYLIGWIYANRARQFFAGSMLTRIVAQVEGRVHLAQTKASFAGTVAKTGYTVNGAMKTVEKKKQLGSKEDGEEEGKKDGEEKAKGGEASDEKSAAETSAGNSAAAPGEGGGGEGGKKAEEKGEKAKEAPEAPASASPPTAAPPKADAPSSADGGGKSQAKAKAKAASAPPPAASAELLPGTLVILSGLTGAAELNNEIGVVCGFDEDAGRYLVQVMPDVGLKKLKRENLTIIEAPTNGEPGEEGGGGGEGAGGSSSTPNPDDAQWANGDDADITDIFKDCMPLFHDACWGVTRLDIEFTLSKVVMKVLKDMSVTKEVRKKRAAALLQLGQIFQEPMKEQRRLKKMEKTGSEKDENASDAGASTTPSLVSPPSPTSIASTNTTTKKSMLARFKPRVPWKPSAKKQTQRAKQAEEKQKRMEAALAMMAAGASTEDVDEMIAARAQMEAELGEGFM